MAFKKSYSRSNKTGFPPFLSFAISSNNTAVAVSGENLHSNETNKYFLAKAAEKKQYNCKSYYGYLMLIVSLCHRGGRMENINAWYLNTHMVYL